MGSVQNKRTFVIYLVVAIGMVVLLNLVARSWFFRLDLTEGQIFSLSSSSQTVLKKVDDLLIAKVYFSDNLPGQYGNTRRYLQDILEEYAAYSGGNFHFEFYSPDDDEKLSLEAQKSGITPVQLQVVENDRLEIKRVYMGMVLLFGDKREVIPVIQTTTGLEYEITIKIKKLVDSERRTVAIASVASDSGPMEMVSELLKESYNVRTLALTATLPDDVDLLIMNGVSDSLSETEMSTLKGYIKRGGNLLMGQNRISADLQVQVGMPLETNVFEILEPFGITLEENLVLDRVSGQITVTQQRGFLRFNSAVNYPFFPLIQRFSDHPIVGGLEQVHMLFTSEITWEADSVSTVQPLMYTSDHSGDITGFYNLNPVQNAQVNPARLNEVGKVVGAYATAVSDSSGATSQLVLVACSEFMVDGGGGRMPENGIFVLNAVDMLIGDSDLVALRSREITSRPLQVLDDASRTTWKSINIALPALLVIAFGLVLWRLEANRTKHLEELYS
ncbi:MAG: Gldg family protein [bacterium]|nr:Gldg family protein [bacterium]